MNYKIQQKKVKLSSIVPTRYGLTVSLHTIHDISNDFINDLLFNISK